MSYLIQYSPQDNKKYPPKRNKKKPEKAVLAMILALIICLTGIVRRKQQDAFAWLIPGNPDITLQAFENLIVDVKAGEPMKEAVTVFCQEVIANAEKEP